MGWFNRYRHGRGFGIHSPFAFRFVTECLNERAPYYDYKKLTGRADRTLYRVACRFQPLKVCALGGADARAALLACPRACESGPDEADMLVVSGNEPIGKEVLEAAVGREAVIYIRGAHRRLMGAIRQILVRQGYGMTFDNRHRAAVVVPRRKLPRQDFEVRF